MLTWIKLLFYYPVKEVTLEGKVMYFSSSVLRKWVVKIIPTKLRRGYNKVDGSIQFNSEFKENIYRRQIMSDRKSLLPLPAMKDLHELASITTEIVFFERDGELHEKYEVSEILKITDKDLISLAFPCFYINEKIHDTLWEDDGYFSFNFVTSENKIQQIAYLGNGFIRWVGKWSRDVKLQNPDTFIDWLRSYGTDESASIQRKEKEYNERIEKEEERHRLWVTRLPKTLLKFKEDATSYNWDYSKVYADLKKEIPSETELLLKLFELLGTGFGVWSGFPATEATPIEILMIIPIKTLNSLEKHPSLSEEQKHGLVRFFSGWDFYKERNSEIGLISDHLKTMMHDHLINFGDEDKLSLFRKRINII